MTLSLHQAVSGLYKSRQTLQMTELSHLSTCSEHVSLHSLNGQPSLSHHQFPWQQHPLRQSAGLYVWEPQERGWDGSKGWRVWPSLYRDYSWVSQWISCSPNIQSMTALSQSMFGAMQFCLYLDYCVGYVIALKIIKEVLFRGKCWYQFFARYGV